MSKPNANPKSSGVTFVGIRTEAFDAMRAFVADALGYDVAHEAPGFVAYRTPAGQMLELFDAAAPAKEHFDTGPVPGFEVEDVDAAVAWLNAHKLEILEDADDGAGTRWVHFRGPDGGVYEFVRHAPD